MDRLGLDGVIIVEDEENPVGEGNNLVDQGVLSYGSPKDSLDKGCDGTEDIKAVRRS